MPDPQTNQLSPQELRDVGAQVINDSYTEFLLQKKVEGLIKDYGRKYLWLGSLVVTLLFVGFGLQAWQTWDVFGKAQDRVRSMEEDLKNEVDGARDMVLTLRERVQEIRIDSQSVGRVQEEMRRAQEALTQSRSESSEMIGRLEESTRYASTMQNTLLTQLSAASGDAQSSLAEVRTLLRNARTDVASQQQSIDELSKRLSSGRSELEARQRELDSRTSELLQTSERLRSLEQLSTSLLSVQASSLVLLREAKSYTLQLPDIAARSERGEGSPDLLFKFVATGVGRETLTINYTAGRADYRWRVANARLSQGACTKLGNTDFDATIEQLYWGFFSPELVLLRVAPSNIQRPCSAAAPATN